MKNTFSDVQIFISFVNKKKTLYIIDVLIIH